MNNRYIHYGSNEFDPDKINFLAGMYGINTFSKPMGCLWSSPIDAPYYGWKDWCENNNFHTEKLDKSFTFSLSDNAKILKIHSNEDLNRIKQLDYLWTYRIPYLSTIEEKMLNFPELYFQGYDGFEIYMASNDIYFDFYGWDVDTLLIWNPGVMIF